MTKDEALQIFRDSGALLEGHFILRSGLHSRQFFQCALALQQMPVVEKLGAALAAKVRPLGAVTIVAPAMGGLVIGQEVARQLGIRFIFVEKEEGKLVLRRGFKIEHGEKILVVEDVVTKGGRVQENAGHCSCERRLCHRCGGNCGSFQWRGKIWRAVCQLAFTGSGSV
ncbi:MAG: phosphoribosyltransferase family protein [Limisphaerales bacterium]